MANIHHAHNAAATIGAGVWERESGASKKRLNSGPAASAAATTINSNFRRRIRPSSRVTLAVLDLAIMGSAIAGLIFATSDRLGFDTHLEVAAVVLCIITGFTAFAYAAGCYRFDALISFSVSFTRLAVGLGVSGVLLVLLNHYLLGAIFDAPAFRSVSRSITIVLMGLGAGMSGGMLSRVIFSAMARRHWFRRRILVIGTGERARHLRDLFRRSDRRLAELHFLSEEYLGGQPHASSASDPIKTLPGAQSVEELEDSLHIDQVVVAVDEASDLNFDRLLPWKANGVPVFDFSSFLERETGRVDLRWTQSDWLLYSEGFRFGWLDAAIKRLLDIVISAGMLLVALPVLAIVAAGIKFEDFGPVFYRQERVSRGGRTFHILKFRTMRVDAEKSGAQWASENDPRITRVGHFLRRSRIDEVPQLINVLRGEMSLVGPRPERPCFVEKLNANIRLYHLRHSVKAGVTGWAQINYPYGASIEDTERKLEYDLYYLKHFSVLRDISIMLQTFRVLVFAQGSR